MPPLTKQAIRSEPERNALAMKHLGLVYKMWFKLRLRRSDVAKLGKEDAVQAGCLGLLRACELYDESLDKAFGSYACYWIANTMMEAACRNRFIRPPIKSQDTPVPSVVSMDDKPHKAKDVPDYRALHEAIESLPPRLREVVQLRLEGVDGAETGRRLGVSRAVVSFRYRQALQRLHRWLAA